MIQLAQFRAAVRLLNKRAVPAFHEWPVGGVLRVNLVKRQVLLVVGDTTTVLPERREAPPTQPVVIRDEEYDVSLVQLHRVTLGAATLDEFLPIPKLPNPNRMAKAYTLALASHRR